jgi:hypothetical protein
MSEIETRAQFLNSLDEILGPDPLDLLREKLSREIGAEAAIRAMRIVRPFVADLEASHRAAKRALRAGPREAE